jgi:hypothetical protein
VSGTVAGVVKTVLGSTDIPEIAMTSPTAPGVTHRFSDMTTLYRRGCKRSYVGWLPLPILNPSRDTDGISDWRIRCKKLDAACYDGFTMNLGPSSAARSRYPDTGN